MSEETNESTATAEATAEQAETKETEAKAEDSQSQEAKQETSESKPETGETGFTIPEGFSMMDAESSDMKSFFGELSSITDPSVREQKMVDKHFELLNKIQVQGQEAQQAQHQEWAKESMTDKEFGGANLSENIAGIRKLANSFSSPAVGQDGKPVLHEEGPNKGQQMTEFEVAANETGAGNHPAFLRMMHRIRQSMSEDSFVQGNMKPHEQKKTPAEILYGGS